MPAFSKSMWLRSLVLAVLAGGFWAGWAYYVNREIFEQGYRAAITQGLFSFLMTFAFAASVEWAYALGGSRSMLYLRTTLVPAGSIALLLPLAHWVRDTPNILATVTPPVLLAVLYCLGFVYARRKVVNI